MSDNHDSHQIDTAPSRTVRDGQLVETPEDSLSEQAEREWDEQIERDVKAGRLDFLIQEALEEHRAGRTRPL